MPIVSPVESKSPKGRLIHAAVFVVLALGGSTMIYPFMIMLSGSVRSAVDQAETSLIPGYLVDTDALYRKFLETKYNQHEVDLMQGHRRPYFSFAQAQPPPPSPDQAVEDLRRFMNDPALPVHWQRLGGTEGFETVPENLRELRSRVRDRLDGDLEALSQSVGTPIDSWLNVILPRCEWLSPRFALPGNILTDIYIEMLREAPAADRQLVSLSGEFLTSMAYPNYGQIDPAAMNNVYGLELITFDAFHLPREVPTAEQSAFRAHWLEFVRERLNPSFISLKQPDRNAYRKFLADRYGTVEQIAQTWSQPITSFDEIDLPQGQWIIGAERLDYAAYLAEQDPGALVLVGSDYAYQDFLEDHYGSVAELNIVYGSSYHGFDEVLMPMAQLEYEHVASHRSELRWAFATRNYINVAQELVLQGRPLLLTIVFVSLCVVLALLVNASAAYAMSRFELPGTFKILLLMMATTAFPPMVTLIPQFIVLRELDLLNTMVALVLPFVLNGYMVFLLKGFFDSLPRELYEAGRIDGAGECRMFFQITLALSKPILAVLGLQTFNAAYTAFLYPLLVAPDRDMWLISVWLYQFQQRNSTATVYASVVVASIPTLVVFLFAQRTIMRGIVVPTEK